MSTPLRDTTDTAPPRPRVKFPPEVEQEYREAMADLEAGRYIDLTPEQLERAVQTGEFPWDDESLG